MDDGSCIGCNLKALLSLTLSGVNMDSVQSPMQIAIQRAERIQLVCVARS